MNMIEYAKIARSVLTENVRESSRVVSTRELDGGSKLHLRSELSGHYLVCNDKQYEDYRRGLCPHKLKMTVIKPTDKNPETFTEKVYRVWMNFNGELV